MCDLKSTNNITTIEDIENLVVITVHSPPVNALSHAVRSGLVDAIHEISARPSHPRSVVLTCAGRTFFARADINEIGKKSLDPDFHAMIQTIESAPFPIIAAIHGTALGGGLEVALACHYRVAIKSAQLGLPEVKLGLLPGAGGTQRLPRLVGVETALEMMTSGAIIDATEALAFGLLDEIGYKDARSLGINFALSLPENAPLRRVRDYNEKLQPASATPDIFERFRMQVARKFPGQDAPKKIIECVEAAVSLSFEEGQAVEHELFNELEKGSQSNALRHVFFAERLAQRPNLIKDSPALPISHVGVLGAGTMGKGIALSLAAAEGIKVTIVDTTPEAAEKAVLQMTQMLHGSASRGRFTMEEANSRISRIHAGVNLSDFIGCDMVIEAIFEDMDVKTSIFAEMDRILSPQTILASNTSYLDINKLAAITSRPEQVLGMHFFSPANVMRLVEVVQGASTAPTVVSTAFTLARKMKKVAVLSGVCHGFIGNRMLEKRQDEAMQLLLEGATPAHVDRVVTAFGFPMGPFAMHDLAGLDLGWSADTSNSETIRDLLCEAGRLGQKSGAGFFDYGPDRKPVVSEMVETMIRNFAAKKGDSTTLLSDEDIRDRLILPMINEGACILDEGIAERASDIDLVWINGYGWPAVSGGPMYWAQQKGLDTIVSRLEALEKSYGPRFSPSHSLRHAAEHGDWV